MKISLTPTLDNGNYKPNDVTFQRIREGERDILRITVREPSGANRDIDFKPHEVEKTMMALDLDGFGQID